MKRRRLKDGYLLYKISAVLLTVTVLVASAFYKMRPVIISFAVGRAERILLDAANNAVLEILKNEEISYSDIVSLKRDNELNVTDLQTDIVKMNTIKSLIAVRVSEVIAAEESYTLKIPIGTFLSSVYTAGYGPELTFKMQMSGTAVVDFADDFKSAGINQVLHTVMIEIELKGQLIAVGCSKGVNTSTSAMAVQTIIVGATPDAFTQVIESETDNTAGLINDYGAVPGE